MFYAKNESLTKSETLVFFIVLNIVEIVKIKSEIGDFRQYYNGILPCFLGGFCSLLLAVISNAEINF